MSAYFVSVALRASIALASQLGASSAKSIRRMWEGTVFQRWKNDLRGHIIEPTEKFGGMFVQCVGRGIDGKRGSRRWHG